MQTCICSTKGQFVSKGLTLLAEFIRDNLSSSAVLFCNSRQQSQHFRDNLERELNNMKLNVDVIHINGSLHKTDKFWCICLFCDKGHINEADYRVLVTKNAANVGIDKSSIALQMQFKWPRDLLTYFPERGRGSRQRGNKLTCTLYSDLSSYVSFMYKLLRGDDDLNGEIVDVGGTGECEGFNSAISPRRQVRQARQANTSQDDYALGPAAKKQLQAQSLTELNKVMQFFCHNYGCQHEQGEIYLSSGLLDSLPALGHCTSYPVYNRTYHKDFLPVYRSGVESFLEWLTATAKLPFTVKFKVQLSSLLMLNAY